MTDSISFPHLGITFSHVSRSITIGSFQIAYYGIVIALAMLAGICVAARVAKKTGQNPDDYYNFALYAIIFSLLGARIYYVIFSWDYYRAHPLEILNFRGGGLAIYGGVIAGVLTGLIYSHRKKIPPLRLLDTAVTGLVTGQLIGRWGNFFNREAFGDYTDSLLAMRLPLDAVKPGDVTQKMIDHEIVIDGVTYIQVHPTFLYESLWNLGVLIVLLLVTFRHKKRFTGEIFALYLLLYGTGRFWIEGLRTDQLKSAFLGVPVSQVLSALLAAGAAVWLCTGLHRIQGSKRKSSVD